jgi:iron(III) transport system permease protein
VVVIGLGVTLVLAVLVAVPLGRLVGGTITPEGASAWTDVLSSRLSENLFWSPLFATITVGLVVGIGSVVLGASLAWLVVMTDAPGRRLIGFLASLPFVLPSFALALAWESVFRNDRVGGRVGLLWEMGLPVPDWLSWGLLPVCLILIAHYFSLVFLLVAAALASVNADLMEAGEMAGASRGRVAMGITLPVVMPAIVAGFLLAFAEGVSNFAVPALLGLPVRFQTLSTRLYGSISTGQTERGFVLAVLLIVVAGLVLYAASRVTGGGRSYATITGKGGRRRTLSLGPWRWPLIGAAAAICLATTIIPGVVLVLSSLARRSGQLTGELTLHYWSGMSDPSIAQGTEGVLRNPQIINAAFTTLLLGVSVAALSAVLALGIGYVVVRGRGTLLARGVELLSFVPFLIPGIALGATYIALFGRPIGPMPALYGTLALLVLAGTAATLPFAAQAGRSTMGQVSGDLEEAAVMAGASMPRRMAAIIVPLSLRGLLAGGVLVFVKMVRDLSLVVLLVTPSTTLLSVITFRYASEGFAQFANAITVVIAGISIGATLLARRLEGSAQPWAEQ